MENILPGFGHHRRRSDELEDYDRRVHSRPLYGPVHVGGYEYTGQPVGFEHLGSPPKQRLEDMDAKTIAQLGYEGPEGERRKVEAINEQIYEREYEREGYLNGVPIEGYRYRDGYADEYGRDRLRHGGHSSYSSGHGLPQFRDRREEEEYRRTGRRYDDPIYAGTRGHVVPIPVQVERKFEEDGTVVENVYPDSTATSALYSPRDPGKIHYGRQDSFPETVLQEAADSAYRHGHYPGRYRDERLPPYGPPYSDGTSSYPRRPYEGSSSDYIDGRRRY